jgi:hypothetical protein
MRHLAATLAVACGGCGATLFAPHELTFDQNDVTVIVDLSGPAPDPIPLRVLSTDDGDVTAGATLTLAGTNLGTIAGATLVLDGRIGGEATIQASFGSLSASLPVTVRLHSTRLVPGTPASAPDTIANAPVTQTNMALEPGDGAIVPPNIDHLEVDFSAEDSDDLHEIAIRSPYLDVRVYGSATPGPRHFDLTADEWTAISRTSRGDGIDLTVWSQNSTATTSSRMSYAHLAIADRDLVGGLVFGGGPNGQAAQLWHYDLATGATPWLQSATGACQSCHVAASPDGKRVAIGGGGGGALIDTQTRALVPVVDAWGSGTFDPSGALVTSTAGVLNMRDASGTNVATLATGVYAAEPTISGDGSALAYVVTDDTVNFVGPALRVHDWNAATATLGPPREIVRIPGGAIAEPELSADGTWILYGQLATPSFSDSMGVAVADTSGHLPPKPISMDSQDWWARWMGPIAPTRIAGRDPAPMAWIVLRSIRTVGGRENNVAQLWLVGFFPRTGEITRPFHLPGQPADVEACMAGAYLP